MSCTNGSCKCGAGCSCGSSCNCMYPDLAEGSTTSTTMILGLAPSKGEFTEFEMATGSENGGCKCGDNCNCNPCKCGK